MEPGWGPKGLPTSQQPEAGPVLGRAGRGRRVSAPRAAIVTGGTGALGRAVVKRLLGAGARVAVSYRRAEEWRSLAAEAGAGAALFGFEAELADPAAAAAFVDQAQQRLGLLDALALVAGGWAGGTTLRRRPRGGVEPDAPRQSRLGGLRLPGGASLHEEAGRQRRGRGFARGRERGQRHGRLRRLEGGAARPRADARAGEPRPGRARERGAARHDRHARESQRHEERGHRGLDVHGQDRGRRAATCCRASRPPRPARSCRSTLPARPAIGACRERPDQKKADRQDHHRQQDQRAAERRKPRRLARDAGLADGAEEGARLAALAPREVLRQLPGAAPGGASRSEAISSSVRHSLDKATLPRRMLAGARPPGVARRGMC